MPRSSSYRGVYFHGPSRKWVAQIRIRTVRFLGSFDDEEDAARAFDNARWHLRDYFPKPVGIEKVENINFQDAITYPASDATEALRRDLIEEEAPTYGHGGSNASEANPEATRAQLVEEMERLFWEWWDDCKRYQTKMDNLFTSLKQKVPHAKPQPRRLPDLPPLPPELANRKLTMTPYVHPPPAPAPAPEPAPPAAVAARPELEEDRDEYPGPP